MQPMDLPILDHVPEVPLRILLPDPSGHRLQPVLLLYPLPRSPSRAEIPDHVVNGTKNAPIARDSRTSSVRVHLEHVDERAGRLRRGDVPVFSRVGGWMVMMMMMIKKVILGLGGEWVGIVCGQERIDSCTEVIWATLAEAEGQVDGVQERQT